MSSSHNKQVSIRFWGITFSLLLSLFVFILFSFDYIIELFSKLSNSETTMQYGNKILVSALQSFVVFLVGSFLSVFLDRFTKLEQNISNTASQLLDELPKFVEEKTESTAKLLNLQLIELRNSLADGMVRTGSYVYRTLQYDENTGILHNHTTNDPSAPRNVLFNNKTICTLLDAASKMEAEIEKIGYECGAGFGPFLNHYLQRKGGGNITFVNMLDLWNMTPMLVSGNLNAKAAKLVR
jgi:hypothetical protein